MTLKIWLIGSGILSAIAILMPWTVVVGMFLIVPGLILIAAPTVFIYLSVFALLRLWLPLPPGLGLNVAAAAITLALGWAVVQPSAWRGKLAFDRLNLPELIPESPIKLSGHVRVVMDRVNLNRDKPPALTCNALCAALLATPGVTAVTLEKAPSDRPVEPATFRLVARGDGNAPSLLPDRPEAILDHLPKEPRAPGNRNFEAEQVETTRLRQAAAADWAVRLASRERLIAEPAREKPDMTILIDTEKVDGAKGTLHRLEIRNAAGEAVVRRSILSVTTLAAPLHVSTDGGLQNFRLVWGKSVIRTGPTYPELNHVTELFMHSNLARPTKDSKTSAELRMQLGEALADVNVDADDPRFALAGVWFSTMDWSKPLSDEDLSLLSRAIAHPRIPITKQLYDGYASKIPIALRGAIGARIVNPETPEEDRRRLAHLLAAMPKGAFATLTADERYFIGNGTLRQQTTPMVTRLADRGAAAVPDLLAILESDSRIEPWAKRWQVLEALCRAFTTLGREAKSALPVVDALVNRERSPLLNEWRNRDDWNFALIRMGKPLNAIDFPNSTPEKTALERHRLRERAVRNHQNENGS
jgi:hypothetical protein